MEEVAGAGEVHGHAGLLGRFDDLLIADGAARLHDGLDARVDKHLGTIGEREERIGCRDRTGGAIGTIGAQPVVDAVGHGLAPGSRELAAAADRTVTVAAGDADYGEVLPLPVVSWM